MSNLICALQKHFLNAIINHNRIQPSFLYLKSTLWTMVYQSHPSDITHFYSMHFNNPTKTILPFSIRPIIKIISSALYTGQHTYKYFSPRQFHFVHLVSGQSYRPNIWPFIAPKTSVDLYTRRLP